LIWQKKPDGVERNWQNAKWYCEGLSLGGFSDWRLPGKEVLEDMIDKKEILDTYRLDWHYWSSTTEGSDAWGVNLGVGDGFLDNKANSSSARCVRGGKVQQE